MANKRSLNRVILIGTAGRDPEITHIPNLDKNVAKFSMVTNEVFMDRKTNQFQEMAEWHNIVAWGYTAQKVERDIRKGSLVLVEGKIKTRKWKDQNEQERRTTEIHADTVTLLDKSQREQGYAGGQSPQQGAFGQPPAGGNFPPSYRQQQQPPPQQQQQQNQAPPEVQYDDINDIPYDDSDPF
jgi:single-strand DNA-binding protein